MARMHPSKPDADTPQSERRVFEKLQEQLPDKWDVIHSRRFVLPASGGRPPQEGEIDFIIVDSQRGFLGLEVKGGQEIRRTPDGWQSVAHNGKVSAIKDPGKQVREAVGALNAYVRAQGGGRGGGIEFPFGWGVVFPDFEVRGTLDPSLPRELVIDRNDLEGCWTAVQSVFEQQFRGRPAPQSGAAKRFLDLVAPTFRLVRPLAARIEDERTELLRATERQIELLGPMAAFRRVAVSGPAGSGKTLVAMERARRLAASGRRVLLLCYNELLAKDLATKADGFDVRHFHALARELCRAAGIQFKPPSDGDQREHFWEVKAPELLCDALAAYPDDRWDDVVVDEGQDFRELWWTPVETLLRNRKSSSLWVFFDPNQDLYGGGPIEALNLERASLDKNCRNTRAIAAHASSLVGIEARVHELAPEGVAVRVVPSHDDTSTVDAVRRELHRLVQEERLESRRITILSPRGEWSPVWRARTLGAVTLVEHPNAPGANQAGFCSIRRFKGLESDAVIVCDVTDGSSRVTVRDLYVACSRARHVLVVVGDVPSS